MSTLYVDTVSEKTAGNGVQIAGHVVQVVNGAHSGSYVTTTSTSFVTSTLSATITPKSSSSLILVYPTYVGYNPSGTQLLTTVYRGASNLGGGARTALGQLYAGSTDIWTNHGFKIFDSPATTSAVTYTLYYKSSNGGGVYLFNTDQLDSVNCITLMEIAQ